MDPHQLAEAFAKSKPAALCRGQAESVGAAGAGADGRWLVNNGDAMDIVVDGLNVDKNGIPQPILCVIDLSTLKASRATIAALYNHETLIGHWSDISIDPAKGIFLTLRITRPANDMEAKVLADAVMVGAHLRAKFPWQASVGIRPRADGHWDLISAGDRVTVNGKTFTGSGDIPLYVLRGGELFETSVCEFGADENTGQIAAKRSSVTASTIPAVTLMDIDTIRSRIAAIDQENKRKDALIAALQEQLDEPDPVKFWEDAVAAAHRRGLKGFAVTAAIEKRHPGAGRRMCEAVQASRNLGR